VESAKRQVRLTLYRLVFRGFYYPPGKGPPPLPPKSGWQIYSTDGAEIHIMRDHLIDAYRGFIPEVSLERLQVSR